MSNTNVDLKQAVTDQDLYTIQCFVVDQQNLLLKIWLNETRENFCSTLQQSLQKSHRTKRQLVMPKDEVSYQLGIWEGCLQVFHILYDEERKENDILELAVSKSPNTEKIIRFLYELDRPICHGELANALEMNYSALTNAMKKVIGCGAVSASRTGRNTRYTLTTAGRKYCQKETAWKNALSKSQEFLLVEELVKSAEKLKELLNGRKQSGVVTTTDNVRFYHQGKLSGRGRFKTIYDIAGIEKILEFELDNNNDIIGDIQIGREADMFSNCNFSSHTLSRT